MTAIGSTSYSLSVATVAGTARSSETTDEFHWETFEALDTKPATDAGDGTSTPAPSVIDGTLPSSATINFQGKLIVLSSLHIGSETIVGRPIWELPEAEYQDFLATERGFREMEKRALEIEHSHYPDPSTDQRLKPYATVMMAGRTVATIDNQGVVRTENDAVGRRLQNLFENELTNTNGPDLAQARAKQIAKFLGGELVVANTAMDQKSFERLSVISPEIDYEAMRNDPGYQEWQAGVAELARLEEKRSQYLNKLSG
ncbi:hypothetical protein ACSV9I_02780 [Rhizobium sp. G187]|uniref:hypothetical protein n=1 Tax=Rhizobium sp. G187 TaxID=3451352 RepID=UPI003EE52B0E